MCRTPLWCATRVKPIVAAPHARLSWSTGRPGPRRRRPFHRLGILKIALDKLDVREQVGFRCPRITRDRANLYVLGRQAFEDFAATVPVAPVIKIKAAPPVGAYNARPPQWRP